MAWTRNRGGQVQDTVLEGGFYTGWLTRLADLIDRGGDLTWSLRQVERDISFVPRYQIITTTEDITLTVDDEVVLADPVSADLTVTLPDVVNGMGYWIKNIDESGTYDLIIDPGAGVKIDGQPAGAAPASADVTLAPLDCYHLVFFDDTLWII